MEDPFRPKDVPPSPPIGGPAQTPKPPFDAQPTSSAMERELQKERQRADAAENLLKQQEKFREEADQQLKSILDQLKREKNDREREEEKLEARGRIDALEERLDEMHHTWAELLKDAVAARNQAGGGSPPAAILAEIERLGTTLAARIAESDRRMSLELEKYEIKLSSLSQERAALQAAMEEERHRLRQEFTKERLAEQEQARSNWDDIRKTLGRIQAGQDTGTHDTASLRDLTEKLHAELNQPGKAKDLIVLDLEKEKKDLIAALKARGEELRAYTDERREVERSMGESLLNLNRELEAERSKYRELESQVSELKLQIQSRDAQLDLAGKSAEDKDARFRALSAERDDVARLLMDEVEKSRRRTESENQTSLTWQKQLEEAQRRLDEERSKRMETESQVADTRAKLQALTDHIAQAIREKERIELQSANWMKEREQLLETLRKKDEMVSMLSATFQNIIKK